LFLLGTTGPEVKCFPDPINQRRDLEPLKSWLKKGLKRATQFEDRCRLYASSINLKSEELATDYVVGNYPLSGVATINQELGASCDVLVVVAGVIRDDHYAVKFVRVAQRS